MHYKGTIFIFEIIKSHMKTQPKQRQRNDKMILPIRGHASVLVSFMLVSEEETCKRCSFAPLDDESPHICRTSSHQTVEIGSGPWPWCRLTPCSVHVRLQSVTWQPWHSPAVCSSILWKTMIWRNLTGLLLLSRDLSKMFECHADQAGYLCKNCHKVCHWHPSVSFQNYHIVVHILWFRGKDSFYIYQKKTTSHTTGPGHSFNILIVVWDLLPINNPFAEIFSSVLLIQQHICCMVAAYNVK